MKVEETLFWNEPRITINTSHPYWETKNPMMKLKGKFVEDCLWVPSIYYTNAKSGFWIEFDLLLT